LAVLFIGPFGNRLNGTPASVVVNNGPVLPGRFPGRFIFLIHCIPHQGSKDGSCGQSDQRAFGVATDGLTDESAGTGADDGPFLGVITVGWQGCARKKQKREQ
jgi:hypothetical protein